MNYEDRIEQISDEKYSYFQRVKDAEAKLREALEAIEDFQVEITKAQIREEELQSGILILQELIKQTKNNNFIGLEEQKNRLNNVTRSATREYYRHTTTNFHSNVTIGGDC